LYRTSRTEQQRLAANQLRIFINIINETVGDAIADLLATEAILSVMNLTLEGWLELYQDLPQRQLKVAVKDRTSIQTTDAERRCTAPAHLQEAIDQLVSKCPSGRSFVRSVETCLDVDTSIVSDVLGHRVPRTSFVSTLKQQPKPKLIDWLMKCAKWWKN
jgi:phosphoacetylglucosamine mutase